MALFKVVNYRVGWSFAQRKGFFRLELAGAGWQPLFVLKWADSLAAVGALLRGNESLHWDGDAAALVGGASIQPFASEMEQAAMQVKGGDGPFPTKRGKGSGKAKKSRSR